MQLSLKSPPLSQGNTGCPNPIDSTKSHLSICSHDLLVDSFLELWQLASSMEPVSRIPSRDGYLILLTLYFLNFFFFFFLLKQSIGWLSAITWQTTGEQRGSCCLKRSFTRITADDVSAWPVLNGTCITTHLESPDLWHEEVNRIGLSSKFWNVWPVIFSVQL